eukprot:TRINITY_DN91_c4_g1_i1.p1 TRINITY_DN91_c4_g1~~TRINITY_DN91_c4_g1_i1.p1  ORF type:complete len:251 (+),score=98.15 TRINITY_DN91_c4_g1_i1:64-816(+)
MYPLILSRDERLNLVTSEEERNYIWEEFVEKMKDVKKQKEDEKKKISLEKFSEDLRLDSTIAHNSSWREFQSKFMEKDYFKEINIGDAIFAFDQYIAELERKYSTTKLLGKEEEKKDNRKIREEFRRLLFEKIIEGSFTIETSWKKLCVVMKDDPRFISISSEKYTGTSGKELFNDAMSGLEKKYKEDKKKLKKFIKKSQISFTCLSELSESVASHPELIGPVHPVHVAVFFQKWQEKLAKQEKKKQRKE